jgi:hypothetical protein
MFVKRLFCAIRSLKSTMHSTIFSNFLLTLGPTSSFYFYIVLLYLFLINRVSGHTTPLIDLPGTILFQCIST